MSISQFNKSVYKRFLDYNDPDVIALSNNLYDKVKGNTILPEYVDRVRDITRDTFSDPFAIVSDSRFTHWNCVENEDIQLDSPIDIGKVFKIRFEWADDNVNSGDILGIVGLSLNGSDLSITFGNATWVLQPNGYHVFELARDNQQAVLYADGAEQSTETYSLNNNTTVLTELLKDGYGRVSNIKITNGDLTLCWWKLQNNQNEGIDTTDFYSLFYPICYINAITKIYATKLLQLQRNIPMIKRYLVSLGVHIDSYTIELQEVPTEIQGYLDSIDTSGGLIGSKENIDSLRASIELLPITDEEKYDMNKYADLFYIFSNWIEQFEHRGTERVLLKKSLDSGVCVMSNSSDSPSLSFLSKSTAIGFVDVDFGTIHEISFDFSFDSSSTGSITFRGETDSHLNISKLSTSEYSVEFSINSSFTTFLEFSGNLSGYHTLRWNRIGLKNWIYIDDELVGSTVETGANNEFIIKQGIQVIALRSTSGSIHSANFTVKSKTTSLKYKCNEGDGYILTSEDGDTLMHLTTNDEYISVDIWARLNEFNNLVQQYVHGELVRLINYTEGDEMVVGFLNNRDIDWTIGSTSPMSQESSNIACLNKLFEKSATPSNLGKYPLNHNSLVRSNIRVDKFDGQNRVVIVADSTDKGINLVGAIVNGELSGLDKYITPVDDSLTYEISFRMKSSCTHTVSNHFSIMFGVYCYDADKTIVGLKNAINNASANLFVQYSPYLTASHLGIGKGSINKDLWFRALIHPKDFVTGTGVQTLNLGVGNNLKFNPSVATKYLSPFIFVKASVGTPEILVWDINVKIADIPSTKGYLGVKNVTLSYLKNNNSTLTNNEVERVINRELFNYNQLNKTKFL